jgi:hypothetical protein
MKNALQPKPQPLQATPDFFAAHPVEKDAEGWEEG